MVDYLDQNFTPKVELSLILNSLVTFQYFLRNEERKGVSTVRSDNPVAEWEQRWSPAFRTKLRMSARKEIFTQARIREEDEDLSPSVQLRYYNDKFFKEFEFITTLGATYSRETNNLESKTIQFLPVLELNMKPLTFFILRASFQPNYTYDLTNQTNNRFSPYFKLKTSLQF